MFNITGLDIIRSRLPRSAAAALMILAAIAGGAPPATGADHAESTSVADDPGADIGDVYAFLDPNDNSRVVLAMSIAGFVSPQQLLNQSFFSPDIVYRFEIENTGLVLPDTFIDVTFSEQTARNQPQTATVRVRPHGYTFTAPTTVQTLAAAPNPFALTTDAATGIQFFAGLTDDPFYFDIIGFNQFVASVLGGTPDATRLQRGRDSFAGYNIHMIALSVPAHLLRGAIDVNTIGVNGVTLRRAAQAGCRPAAALRDGAQPPPGPPCNVQPGGLVQVDRGAVPAIATALIPFPRKNEFNASTPKDDAEGRFAGDIVATLKALGTNDANIAILASVAVAKGDYLRLNLGTANASVGAGQTVTTPGYTGFPNGRRPGDDVIDSILYFVANQTVIGDSVSNNDVPYGTRFPFFAPPQQTRAAGTIDDNTRN